MNIIAQQLHPTPHGPSLRSVRKGIGALIAASGALLLLQGVMH